MSAVDWVNGKMEKIYGGQVPEDVLAADMEVKFDILRLHDGLREAFDSVCGAGAGARRIAALRETSAAALLDMALAQLRAQKAIIANGLEGTGELTSPGDVEISIGDAACLAILANSRYGDRRGKYDGEEVDLAGSIHPADLQVVVNRAVRRVESMGESHLDGAEEIGALSYIEIAMQDLRYVLAQRSDPEVEYFSPVDHLLFAISRLSAAVVRYEEGSL